MNKERLLKLAEFLETSVPNEEFDLGSWRCGTTACAVGWACTMPEFTQQGLVWSTMEDDFASPYYKDQVTGKEFSGWNAVGKFFLGVEKDYMLKYNLFAPDFYPSNPTPQMVAARIRQTVENAE